MNKIYHIVVLGLASASSRALSNLIECFGIKNDAAIAASLPLGGWELDFRRSSIPGLFSELRFKKNLIKSKAQRGDS
jgi:hypothetical protein